MITVLDASAALEIAMQGKRSEEFASAVRSSLTIAPLLYKLEITNVLWKYVRAGAISAPDASEMQYLLLAFVDAFDPMDSAMAEILGESVRCNHPAYDMAYLVLARRNNAVLLTCDTRLAALAEKMGVKTRKE